MSVVSASSEEDMGDEFQLGRILKQLGSVMIEVGLLVGHLCDQASPGAEIENAILESGTAKGRLIHYHSLSESIIRSLKASCGSAKKAKSKIRKAFAGEVQKRESEGFSGGGNQGSEPWQQWHFDYGLLTVLTSPLYLKWKSPASLEGIDPNMASCSIAPSSWTHGADGDHSGLTIMHRGAALRVKIPPDCLLVSVKLPRSSPVAG
ncbi:hypothetical protein R1flu_017219 [Riccia fluitans]|uniref:Uncharacterized protein n=1 Tax=Riccia fluitans TaxID=41844 RepID=A0ABD1XGR9_9MARC